MVVKPKLERMNIMSSYENLTKAELIEMLNNQSKSSRKNQVLECLKSGVDTIEAISEKLNIQTKNVSSQLTYLRKDGYNILTVSVKDQSILLLLSQEELDELLSKRNQ